MGEEIIKQMVVRLNGAIAAIGKDLSTVRTGRAKSSLVEDVKVEAYGTVMTVKELAVIAVPDPSLITLSPWDKSLTQAVAAGVNKAGLNLNAVVDGEVIKIAIPALSEERRREMVKQVAAKIESGKVMMRGIRTEIKIEIEKLKGGAGVSEDNIKTWLGQMQKEMDEYMTKVDQMGEEKERELMTI